MWNGRKGSRLPDAGLDERMDQHEPAPPTEITFTAAELAGIDEAIADFEANGGFPMKTSGLGWIACLLTNPFKSRS